MVYMAKVTNKVGDNEFVFYEYGHYYQPLLIIHEYYLFTKLKELGYEMTKIVVEDDTKKDN